ncbi:MAG: hypothetical protein A2X59_00905 [Nitrospirae bacterium GWC2_42_7]|nr:MAG: hypothetical protein A2X59_00905 [Nitrospirae bacterium GWC2_42_7]
MNRLSKLLSICSIVLLLISIISSFASAECLNIRRGKYIAGAAESTLDANTIVGYAQKFAYHYNPKYNSYPNDCTNFVSQALIEGFGGKDAAPFGCVKNSDIIGKDGYTKGEIGVLQFIADLQNNFCFKKVNRLLAQPGDILSQKGESHVVIYAGNNQYYGHTNDSI